MGCCPILWEVGGEVSLGKEVMCTEVWTGHWGGRGGKPRSSEWLEPGWGGVRGGEWKFRGLVGEEGHRTVQKQVRAGGSGWEAPTSQGQEAAAAVLLGEQPRVERDPHGPHLPTADSAGSGGDSFRRGEKYKK